MGALKIIALLVVAAVSLYIGFRLEPVAMAVMYDPQYYEHTFPLAYRQALYRYYFFIVGVVVTTATLIAARLLRRPGISRKNFRH